MKKFKLALLGAFIIAAASAFTAAKPVAFSIAYGKDVTDGRTYQVNTQDAGVTYDCISGNEYCLYQDAALTTPLPGQQQNQQFKKLP